MSQSLLYHAFGVRVGYDYIETLYQDGCIRLVLSLQPDWIKCPECGSKDIARKGRHWRELQTLPIGLQPVFLVAEVPKCQCAACGKRFECDLAAVTGLSWDTFKGIVKKALEKGYGQPLLKDLRYLSIDEIYLGRRQKYVSVTPSLSITHISFRQQESQMNIRESAHS